jgi:hypothetical protein
MEKEDSYKLIVVSVLKDYTSIINMISKVDEESFNLFIKSLEKQSKAAKNSCLIFLITTSNTSKIKKDDAAIKYFHKNIFFANF